MNKKEIILIAIARAFSAAGFVISIPFLNIYLYEKKGIPMKLIGLLVSTASFTGALSRIPTGYIGQKIGCKNLMLLGLFSRVIAFSLLVVFIIVDVPFQLFLLAFVLNSIGFALFTIGSDTFVGLTVKENLRPRAYGILRVGANVGFAVGPAIGGFLAHLSYKVLFITSALLSLFVIPLLYFGISCPIIGFKDTGFIKEIKGVLENKSFIVYIIGVYLLFALIGQLISTLSVFAKEKGLSNIHIGYLYSINGFSVVLLQVFFTRITERIGIRKALLLGNILYIVGYMFFGFSDIFIHFAVGVFIFTAGEMLALPLITTITSLISVPEKRSIYIGFQGLAEGLGWATGPLFGGIVLDLFIDSPPLLWAILSIPGIKALIIFYKKVLR